MNHSCTSPIIRSANSVEKMQVFWAWSSLRMSACTVPRTRRERLGADALVGLGVDDAVARDAEQPDAEPVARRRQLAPVDRAARPGATALARLPRRRVSRRCRSTCWSIAALRKKARMIGAGPLIVIDTDVDGAQRSKPE